MAGERPKVGLLLGDPTGIGPELVAKLLKEEDICEWARVLVIGDCRVFEMGQKIANVEVDCRVVEKASDMRSDEKLAFLDFSTISPTEIELGKVNGKAGKAVLETLSFAIKLAKEGDIDAIVYAPLNKQAMLLAGSPFEDELRFFVHELEWGGLHGELNVLDDLWTSRVTSHVPIREVSSLINERRVYEAIVLIDSAMRSYGHVRPRIAVSALNPHSGEGGFFGQEERESIAPAIEKARAQGIDANGPFSADTIFLRAKRDNFDGIVSMYHDQGQIAMKLMGFERSITINGGLPIPITTPAHGTAHDIAGRGIANPGALKRALFVASRMASNAEE